MYGMMSTHHATPLRFTLAKGRGVTAEDKAKEGLAEDDDDGDLDDLDDGDGEPSRSQSKKKGKSKKGGVCAQEKQVGAGVRKFFERYDEEFDGQVGRLFFRFFGPSRRSRPFSPCLQGRWERGMVVSISERERGRGG